MQAKTIEASEAFDIIANEWQTGTPGLRFLEDDHSYHFEGRRKVSVTQLIQSAGMTDYSMVPADILAHAQKRGRYIHAGTQFIDEGKLNWTTLDPVLRGYLKAYVSFKESVEYRPGIIEAGFYSKSFDFAGTPDRVCMINGVCGILDFKSSVIENPADAIQTVGYYIMIRENIPAINCRKRWRLKLNSDGTFKLSEFFEIESDLRVFLAAREVNAWKRTNMKTVS